MRCLTLSLEAMISVPGPSGQPIYRKKYGNIGWNMIQVLFDIVMKIIFQTWCSTLQKKQKLVTETLRQNHNVEVVDRSWLCFSPSQACVKCFDCRLICADTTKWAHFLIRNGICDWKHTLERRNLAERGPLASARDLLINTQKNNLRNDGESGYGWLY